MGCVPSGLRWPTITRAKERNFKPQEPTQTIQILAEVCVQIVTTQKLRAHEATATDQACCEFCAKRIDYDAARR